MASDTAQQITLSTPPSKVYRDLPFSPVSYWDTVPMVRRALDDLERGIFRSAAHLADAMLRDDRIAGVLTTRVNGLLSQPLDFIPPSGEDAQQAELAVVERAKKCWPRIAPDSDLEDLLKWGLLLNAGPGELIWTTSENEWVPRVRTWHPSQLYWRWDTRSYWINTEEGQVEIPNPAGGSVDRKWVFFTPYGYERGWMRGAIRALALPWLVRSFARRDWANSSEQHGQGIKVAAVPISAPTEEREKFVRMIATLGAAGTIEAPTLPNGEKFDVRFVEAMGDSWEGFQALLGHADTAIAIILLGQNLTTEIGEGGSRAAAQVHDNVRKDFQQSDDRKLGGALRAQVLCPYALFNVGNEALAPCPKWQTEPPEDLTQRGTALTALGTFLTAAKTAGAPVNQRALLEEFGVEALTPEEEAQQKQDAAERAAQATAAMQKPGQGNDEGDDQEPPQLHSDRETLPRGARRGQAYVDRLADMAIQHAAQTLDVDLQELQAQVNAAASPADLRHRLVKAYRGMGLTELTLLMDRAQVLAQLAGKRSVLEDA